VDLAPVMNLTKEGVSLPARLLAIGVLAERSEGEALQRLKALGEDSDWAIRAAAIRALLENHPEGLEASFSPADETDPLVRSLLNR